MSDPLILVLDLGLTHAKCVVFAHDGTLIEREGVPYPTQRPTADHVEQDPDDWWAALRAAALAIGERSPDVLRRVEAMGVTGHMHGLVLEDRDRRPIGSALVLGDRRAIREAETITGELEAARIARTTGATLDPSMPAAELRWIADHEPERMAGMALITGPKDHLRGRLTDDRLTEPIDACATSLYDIRERDWSPDLLKAAGVRADRLPQVVACETVAGPLRGAPAAELGVRSGISVVVGAGDDVEVIGGGLLEPGEALEHIGTTGSILAVANDPVDDPTLTLELYPHVLPDRWVVGGSTTTAGAALGWTAELLGFSDTEAMLAALDRHPNLAAGPRLEPVFVASMAGDRCPIRDPAARGAWVGLDSTFDRGGLARSAFHGVAFALERILRAIEQLLGPQGRVVVSAGGTDLDPRWLSLRAAAYRRPLVTLESPEPTALGLAAVTATGVQWHPDIRTAVRAMCRRHGETVPTEATIEELVPVKEASDRAVEALRAAWTRLEVP